MKLNFGLFITVHVLFLLAISGCFDTHYYSTIKTGPYISSNELILRNIIYMDNQYHSTNVYPQKDYLLYNIGKSIMNLDISVTEFIDNTNYKTVCHLRIAYPSGTNKFIIYDGYHFKKLLTEYPGSYYITNAAYYLTGIIPETQNFRDLYYERNRLLEYMTMYPDSENYTNAKTRYNSINEYLDAGGNHIIYSKFR